MSVDFSFHRCTNVRVAHTYVDNSNSVQLVIHHDDSETEITLYNLPTAVTNKFAAFYDEETDHYRRNKDDVVVLLPHDEICEAVS